jgi:hypothetical protein
MASENENRIGIRIDALTNSIVNTISGDSFPTEVYPLATSDIKLVSTKKGWIFNWSSERKLSTRKVFKLTIRNNPDIIQGLVSISDNDSHYYLHLIESAPFNLGKNKLYEGVPGNLFAFTCRTSWDTGYEGFVAFASKTRLIEHYEKSLGATHIGGNRMVIYPHDALKLIHRYYPELK